MAANLVAWTYTDDLGNTYSRGVSEYMTTQTAFGFPLIGGTAVAALQAETLPSGIKPRTMSCILPSTGKRRRIVIFETSLSQLWLGNASTINLQEGDGSVNTYTVFSRTGERRRTRAPGL